ncbi:hypothetical protein BRADI_1g64927v3 [Brachypodium distachyon]|uniref:Small-subunit processome Utp12 domain-containing protein n=1 Tax=Brachypodium distachyon TaxID=15368 RepID=A0A2K2DTF0_BRADI|nr:hypothetical protein BRADI_1g64927v3 [Brachypodium distachyon]
MAPAPAPIRDLLTSFSPAADFLALSSGDGRIKVWDAVRGSLQTEFADIPAVEVGAVPETKRGHLALDYTCMKWVQLSGKKKRKAGSSLLVLGTGSGDVLALDVAAGQWKWRINDCHPGGVTAVAYSRHGRSVYSAGADGMVCRIDSSDGSVAGKFKSSSKAISALAVSPDGNILATAAGQLRTFDASDNKKVQKFSGHPVAVRSMTFSDNGKYILSSGVGERYVAIWKLGSGIDGPDSAHVLLAYGSVVKPSFDKLLVSYGKDIDLGVSEDGVLLPTIQPTVPQKGQSAKTRGTITALDRANAEDAILPLPKLHTHEKKRKHGTEPSGDIKPAILSNLGTTTRTEKRVPVQRIEDDSICIEDMMRECGVIDQNIQGHPDMPTKILSDLFGSSSMTVEANLPSKKIRSHLRSLRPEDSCKFLENLVSAWRTRCGSAEIVLRWIYCLLVIHGRLIPSEKSTKLISDLEKMCAERYAATEDLLKLSGRLRLIMAQVDKDAKDVSDKVRGSAPAQSDEEEEEEIDELVYGEDVDLSENSGDDAE